MALNFYSNLLRNPHSILLPKDNVWICCDTNICIDTPHFGSIVYRPMNSNPIFNHFGIIVGTSSNDEFVVFSHNDDGYYFESQTHFGAGKESTIQKFQEIDVGKKMDILKNVTKMINGPFTYGLAENCISSVFKIKYDFDIYYICIFAFFLILLLTIHIFA